ncbi:MAG: hypothetical protein HKL88_02290 [Bacteroidia bacterium]|nr:hypothetical protein [Bacteroidia bacterium]
MMFYNIFRFELAYRFKRPATYIYFGLFLAFAYLIAIMAGGAFDSVNISLGGSGGKVFSNSPYSVALFTFSLNYLGIIIIAAMVANPVYRDFEYSSHALFFTKPISKWAYLGGRFLGSCVAAMFALTGIAFGLMLGSAMPFLNADMIGPFHQYYYVKPYLTLIIPNLVFIGMIFFMLATLTRRMLPVYIASILLLIFLNIAAQLVKTISNEYVAALLNPLGGNAISYVTRYWTVAQKNSSLIPFTGVLVYNRLIWLGVGFVLFAVVFKRFSFDQFSSEWGRGRKNLSGADKGGAYVPSAVTPHPDYSLKGNWYRMLNGAFVETMNIIRSPYFLAIVFAGMVFMFVSGVQFGKIYDTNTYPVTGQMASGLAGVFSIFLIIIIIFYSGEMIWKERELKLNQIYDAMPVPGWVGYTSKLIALSSIVGLLLFMVMFCGIIIQIFYGYYHFEIPVYLKSLFGVNFIDLVLMAVFVLFIQTLVNNKFIGFFVIIAYYLFNIFIMNSLGWNDNLYNYSSDPGMPYSAMNGYGHFWTGFLWFKFYWACFAVMLAVLTNLFWVRGTVGGFRERLKTAGRRFTGISRVAFFCALALFVASGSYIYYNTHVLNHYTTSYEDEKQTADYEKKYKKYEHAPQPRIVALTVNTNIYPYRRKIDFNGYYVLLNKTNRPVDSIHLVMPSQARRHIILFGANEAAFAGGASSGRLVLSDSLNDYYIYRLDKPLMPHDSILMHMNLEYANKGFANTARGGGVVYNGTFTNSGLLPAIGYQPVAELGDNIERKKFGLPYKEPFASLYDTAAMRNSMISNDADWIRYDATLSTSGDQTALTSGNLVKKWSEGGRNYFHYVSGSRILYFVPFVSAKYDVMRDTWNNIKLAIYYTKGHEYNLERMMSALKDGLSYYTKNFGPYQFGEVKILEFPYAAFAQSFANTIPFSENIGFIARVDDGAPSDVDYPYYVTAHELGHQWWAHQVIGANVQGATMLDETMAQYSAGMVMKHKFGPDRMKKFLRYEMDQYLRGRSVEREKEVPLYRVEDQGYIHYRKGSVIMYALQDYIGEYNLDSALSRYISKVKFQEPPYTTTLQWLDYVNRAVPDSMKYILTDMFTTITVFNNSTKEASWKKEANGTYTVHLAVEAHKLKADSSGNQKEVNLNDWIDIGVFAKPEKGEMRPLYMAKKHITSAKAEFDITIKEQPYEAGIDPYDKLIDLSPEDNVMTCTAATK